MEHRGGVVHKPEKDRMEADGFEHHGGVVRVCVCEREREKERERLNLRIRVHWFVNHGGRRQWSERERDIRFRVRFCES